MPGFDAGLRRIGIEADRQIETDKGNIEIADAIGLDAPFPIILRILRSEAGSRRSIRARGSDPRGRLRRNIRHGRNSHLSGDDLRFGRLRDIAWIDVRLHVGCRNFKLVVLPCLAVFGLAVLFCQVVLIGLGVRLG